MRYPLGALRVAVLLVFAFAGCSTRLAGADLGTPCKAPARDQNEHRNPVIVIPVASGLEAGRE